MTCWWCVGFKKKIKHPLNIIYTLDKCTAAVRNAKSTKYHY